jgi:hypothetical protein
VNPSVTCYPIPGKPKALRLCEAFAAGVHAGGGKAEICTEPPAKLQPGAAVFYGVRPAVAHLWEQAKREGRDWYYIDNAYFDVARERYFRVTKNALQCSGAGTVPVDMEWRFGALGLQVQPWRQFGGHIVICPQSDEFMKVVAGWTGGWLDQIRAELRTLTPRRLVVREKGKGRPLAADLIDAWALVTHSSAAANEAVLAGVPAFVTGRCATGPVSMNQGIRSFRRIEERPWGFDARRVWGEILARSQWTLDEITKGDAWKALQ